MIFQGGPDPLSPPPPLEPHMGYAFYTKKIIQKIVAAKMAFLVYVMLLSRTFQISGDNGASELPFFVTHSLQHTFALTNDQTFALLKNGLRSMAPM